MSIDEFCIAHVLLNDSLHYFSIIQASPWLNWTSPFQTGVVSTLVPNYLTAIFIILFLVGRYLHIIKRQTVK